MSDDRDDRISDALRRRPSDEPEYRKPLRLDSRPDRLAEPLTTLVPSLGVGGGHPEIQSRTPIRAVPALVILALIAAALLVASAMQSTANPPTGPSPSVAAGLPTYLLTGRVACFGQGPGWTPTPGGPLDDCPNMAVPPDGYGAADWALDPAFAFSADSTEIHVVVGEMSCHGTYSATGRIAQHVEYAADRVVVTLAVRSFTAADFPPSSFPLVFTCPGTPGTPAVIKLSEPVGTRTLFDGDLYPAVAVATAGHEIVTPSPTPYPANWHQPMECAGVGQDVDLGGFWKAASMDVTFDVYCPVLPAGWSLASDNEDQLSGVSSAGVVTIAYNGPNGATLSLREGHFCEPGGLSCGQSEPAIAQGYFGDHPATLGGSGHSWSLYTAPSSDATWEADGDGLSKDQFLALTAALILVGK
jgi:hypothetical protein